MASSLALRRAAHALNLVKNLVRSSSYVSINPAHSFSRSFNSNASAEMIRDGDEDEHVMDIDRRSSDSLPRRRFYSPNLLSDAFDPLSIRDYDLGSLYGMLDNMMKNPFVQPTVSRGTSELRRGWNVKEAEDALHLKIEMPGLGKENVKVSVVQNTLTIKGEGEKEDGDDENVSKYSSRIELPKEHYKLDQVKAEIKNGILRVTVPKVKEDEKTNVHHVNVE